MNSSAQSLTFSHADGQISVLETECDLQALLAELPNCATGQSVTLARGLRQYVKATRRGAFWSAQYRCGGWWTRQSFTAEMTTDYSARQVMQDRAQKSLRKLLWARMYGPPPEYSLSTAQIETILREFYHHRRFSIPFSGA